MRFVTIGHYPPSRDITICAIKGLEVRTNPFIHKSYLYKNNTQKDTLYKSNAESICWYFTKILKFAMRGRI